MVEIGKLEATPVGPVWAAATEHGLLAVSLWDDAEAFAVEVARGTGESPSYAFSGQTVIDEALLQISDYLGGKRQSFDLPLDWSLQTPFQREVLELVLQVPYGRKTTYQAIAEQLGKPGAARAVGRANATNPIPLVIPCHRVLGADGSLHGYGAPGGIETKAWLLRLEGSWLL